MINSVEEFDRHVKKEYELKKFLKENSTSIQTIGFTLAVTVFVHDLMSQPWSEILFFLLLALSILLFIEIRLSFPPLLRLVGSPRQLAIRLLFIIAYPTAAISYFIFLFDAIFVLFLMYDLFSYFTWWNYIGIALIALFGMVLAFRVNNHPDMLIHPYTRRLMYACLALLLLGIGRGIAGQPHWSLVYAAYSHIPAVREIVSHSLFAALYASILFLGAFPLFYKSQVREIKEYLRELENHEEFGTHYPGSPWIFFSPFTTAEFKPTVMTAAPDYGICEV